MILCIFCVGHCWSVGLYVLLRVQYIYIVEVNKFSLCV